MNAPTRQDHSHPASHRDIAADLTRWAAAHYGASAEVRGLHRMPGHSGITYGFEIVDGDQADPIVMRVPPVGVRHQHNLDVVRLAPLLELVGRVGVPVPIVRWSGSDEQWFGTPYLMVSRVTGAALPDVFDQQGGPFPDRGTADPLFRQAIGALARIHQVDASPLLEAGWATPLTVEEDLQQWIPLLLKSEQPEEIRHTHELRERLLATAPADERIGVVHGDFYSNNWLCEAGRLTAVLDWENSTLNRPMWDLGWLATIYDPACWGPSRSGAMTWHPGPDDLYRWYDETGLGVVRHPQWYQALMCYRLASITPSKVRLHRTGRRVDPIWEVFAEAIPHQLDRAFALLGELT